MCVHVRSKYTPRGANPAAAAEEEEEETVLSRYQSRPVREVFV